jgi:hypothetical protein
MTERKPGRMIVPATILAMAALTISPAVWTAQPESQIGQIERSPELQRVLKAAMEYCQKLESAALDFVCLEEIHEMIDPSRDVLVNSSTENLSALGQRFFPLASPTQKIRRSLVYDYQYVRKEGRIKEGRILLEEDGKKTRVENAGLKTSVFRFGNHLLSPLGILKKSVQPAYVYELAGTAVIDGRTAVLVEAKPYLGIALPTLYGRIAFDRETLGILRVEWSPRRVGSYFIFEQRGERFKAEPRLRFVSEFGVEKNGIRFPNRCTMEEAYAFAGGQEFLRSRTTVDYRQFKFFTVDVGVVWADGR